MIIKKLNQLSNCKCKNCGKIFDGFGYNIEIGIQGNIICENCFKDLKICCNVDFKEYVVAINEGYFKK